MSSDKNDDFNPDVDAIKPDKLPKPYIEIFSTHPDAFKLNSDVELEDPDADWDWDEMLESQGAQVHSETYFPASNRTVRK